MPATCQGASVTVKPCHERAKAPLAPQVPLSRAINPKHLTGPESCPSGIRATAKSRCSIKGGAGLMGRSGAKVKREKCREVLICWHRRPILLPWRWGGAALRVGSWGPAEGGWNSVSAYESLLERIIMDFKKQSLVILARSVLE